MMTSQELKNIAEQTPNNILAHIVNNPSSTDEIVNFLKNNSKYKKKYYEVVATIKDAKQNKNGIGALKAETMKEVSKEQNEHSIVEIDISLLVENPYQPRMNITEESIEGLAMTIKRDGLSSPVNISPIENSDKYYIASGHRRVAAHKKLGLNKIKCIIKQLDEKELRRAVLIENIQREDLNPIEKALSLKQEMESGIYESQRELANDLGLRESNVSETLSILKLEDKIIKDLRSNKNLRDVTTLALLNKVKPEIQYEVYELLKNGEIDREGIRKYIKNKSLKKVSQCETHFKNNKLELSYKTILKNKDKQKEFADFAKKATEKLIEELKNKEQELGSK